MKGTSGMNVMKDSCFGKTVGVQFLFSIAEPVAYSSPVFMKRINVVQYGLGPIGLETLRLAARKPWLCIIGPFDIDPGKVGQDWGQLRGTRELRRHASAR